ncbi:hypothetical protein JCM19232_3141 [Vibrio ishigakensis]|uniref:Lipoprotein n=2 Tax=Vibrio ishigakensis TaxID=1481914 RepID=A0A0B8PNW3_9VIBR|nr:DUF2799 domain-containing protein [Vibrio ishigakensis]GAM64848.1 hypothetical protein JCM19232_3141 [Vibrio ishigakensis]
MRTLLIALGVSLLAGCAMTPESASWQELGAHRGGAGLKAESAEQLSNRYDLQEVNSQQYDEYTAGFEQGRNKYCNPAQAYNYGKLGNQYKGQCAGLPQEAEFAKKMNKGYQQLVFNSMKKYY